MQPENLSIGKEEAALVFSQVPALSWRRGWYPAAKAALEWIAAAVLLILCAPLIGLMALATKLTSQGPAIYRQVRCGRGGREFVMYKIRTMTHNCEAATGPVWSRGNDSRVTRLGRLLRDTHLDELPQLVCVLRGEMSLIGPRPERPEIVQRLERSLPRYRERLQARPGLTGLAQVQRPPDGDLEDVRHKLAYDLYYIQHMSLAMDLRIAMATALQMAGAVVHAGGKLLVRSCGLAADRTLESVPLIAEQQDRRVGVA